MKGHRGCYINFYVLSNLDGYNYRKISPKCGTESGIFELGCSFKKYHYTTRRIQFSIYRSSNWYFSFVMLVLKHHYTI
jgi:hypothetical protein